MQEYFVSEEEFLAIRENRLNTIEVSPHIPPAINSIAKLREVKDLKDVTTVTGNWVDVFVLKLARVTLKGETDNYWLTFSVSQPSRKQPNI